MAGSGRAHLRGDAALLSVEDLVVEYPSGRGVVHAVSGVSFDVVKGETVGIVGESGCGKSTVARAIVQLTTPKSGTVRFDGTDLTELSSAKLRMLRSKLQIIFQDPRSSLNPRRRVRQVVAEGLRVWRRGTREERNTRVRDALESVGLDYEASANRRPGSFSGGQCQRISIARALVVDPEVLVCDEPVSSLDVSVQAQIINLLLEMKSRLGLTIVFIGHDLAVVKNVSDRVVVMYLGKICEVAPPDELYAEPAHPYTAGLLAAVPLPDPRYRGSQGHAQMWGDVPSAHDPPSGCRFRTRCPRAEDICAEQEPAVRTLSEGHFVACHFPLDGHAPDWESGPVDDTADQLSSAEHEVAAGSALATLTATDQKLGEAVAAPRAAVVAPTRRRQRRVSAGRFAATKLVRFVATALIVTLATTLLINMTPGSPATYMLGENASPEAIEGMNRVYNFDEPVLIQYALWLGDVVTGDFGTSPFTRQPVREAIGERLPVTVEIAALAIALALFVSIPLAMLAAYRPGSRLDRLLNVTTSALIAVPVFLWAILLIYVLSVRLQIFPLISWSPIEDGIGENLRSLTLPVTAVAIPEIVILSRLLRTELIDVLRQEYITLARSKGVSTVRIMLRHALKPASFSLITLAGLSLARLLGGTVIVETVFVLPGLGTLLIKSIQTKDAITTLGVVTFVALVVLVVNLVVDLSYRFLDPRTRATR